MRKGCIYLVGAGPGDPGLITVRAAELLAGADVVVYDYLASPRLLKHARADAELIYVGKQAARHAMSQDQINQLLVAKARGGAAVVRLKGGDPYVFGRGGEEALAAVEAGVPFEEVPGVTSGIAAPAYAGIPVTHRLMAGNVGLVTGHETPDKEASDLDYEALARWKGTLVFYMGVANVESICRQLMEHGLDAATPAAIVRWGTTVQQQVVTATVATLAQVARDANLMPPALIVVGQVVRLRERLNWFERRALHGRRIVVTRSREHASGLTDALTELGAEVIEMPTIRIAPPQDDAPLRAAAANPGAFDWIVFTSVNAVDGFFNALAAGGLDSRALAPCRLCVIGPVTAERLAGYGLRADAQPPTFAGSEVTGAMAAADDLRGKKILCPRSDIAPRDLIDALTAAGACVTEVIAYRTEPDCRGAEQVLELLQEGQVGWITFTSSSTVKNFFDAVSPDAVRSAAVRLASIGPMTTRTLAGLGLAPAAEANVHTIDGLIACILDHERAGGSC
ncbi:MAG: uroporphyrinogen-III C-methyltransferase [Planctomycetaceae bacterium]|nr:uroporphyrinogen-III C-methyltransferase [Planctomycetaceae bacterium]